jgi:hypothetical protein
LLARAHTIYTCAGQTDCTVCGLFFFVRVVAHFEAHTVAHPQPPKCASRRLRDPSTPAAQVASSQLNTPDAKRDLVDPLLASGVVRGRAGSGTDRCVCVRCAASCRLFLRERLQQHGVLAPPGCRISPTANTPSFPASEAARVLSATADAVKSCLCQLRVCSSKNLLSRPLPLATRTLFEQARLGATLPGCTPRRIPAS